MSCYIGTRIRIRFTVYLDDLERSWTEPGPGFFSLISFLLTTLAP